MNHNRNILFLYMVQLTLFIKGFKECKISGACEKNPSCYNFKEESLQIILDDNKCKYNNVSTDI